MVTGDNRDAMLGGDGKQLSDYDDAPLSGVLDCMCSEHTLNEVLSQLLQNSQVCANTSADTKESETVPEFLEFTRCISYERMYGETNHAH